MSKSFKILFLLFLAVFLCAVSVPAIPTGNLSQLQGVLDDITTAPVAGDSSVNVATDFLSDNADSYWYITDTGGSISTLIIELAGFAELNKFGVFDMTDSTTQVELFDGASTAGDQITLGISNDGEVLVNSVGTGTFFNGNAFGYYLDATVGNGNDSAIFFSDTLLNADGFDHMAAYQGNNTDTVQLPGLASGLWTDNEFILAFEDLFNGGDKDFNDFVVMVESVKPIPEPATMLLVGSGMIGLAGLWRRKFFKK